MSFAKPPSAYSVLYPAPASQPAYPALPLRLPSPISPISPFPSHAVLVAAAAAAALVTVVVLPPPELLFFPLFHGFNSTSTTTTMMITTTTQMRKHIHLSLRAFRADLTASSVCLRLSWSTTGAVLGVIRSFFGFVHRRRWRGDGGKKRAGEGGKRERKRKRLD
jgi:hypothetical protein